MANFTPEEISEILAEFFDVTGKRQYTGARYVPVFGRRNEDTIAWDNSAPYEPLTIVIYQGNSYTSRTYVPAGVAINNQTYWALTGNYNAQVELYRQETAAVKTQIDATDALIPKTSFDSVNTVKQYIDTNDATITEQVLQRCITFDTVADMQNYTALYEGAICHTSGFHTKGDGGAAYYEISSNGTANGMDLLECGSLIAHLLPVFPVSLKMLGAYGDGTHDDYSVVNRSLSLLGYVFATSGTYLCDSKIVLAADSITIYGTGHDCIIKASSSITDDFIYGNNLNNIVIHDIKIDNSLSTTESTGECSAIRLDNSSSVLVYNVNADYAKASGVWFANCRDSVIDSCVCCYSNAYAGITVSCESDESPNVKISNCNCCNNALDGILIASHNVTIENCICDNNGQTVASCGVYANNRNNLKIIGCHTGSNSASGIELNSMSSNVTVTDCVIVDNYDSGIHCYQNDSKTVENYIFTKNICIDNASHTGVYHAGIHVFGYDSDRTKVNNVIVVDNICIGNDNGILCRYITDLVLRNNVSKNNTTNYDILTVTMNAFVSKTNTLTAGTSVTFDSTPTCKVIDNTCYVTVQCRTTAIIPENSVICSGVVPPNSEVPIIIFNVGSYAFKLATSGNILNVHELPSGTILRFTVSYPTTT